VAIILGMWPKVARFPSTSLPNAALISCFEACVAIRDAWIVDSGCAQHVCNNASRFVKIDKYDGPPLRSVDTSTAPSGIGEHTHYPRSKRHGLRGFLWPSYWECGQRWQDFPRLPFRMIQRDRGILKDQHSWRHKPRNKISMQHSEGKSREILPPLATFPV
jgi:hypothetical protein